jgi:hypothetical protein
MKIVRIIAACSILLIGLATLATAQETSNQTVTNSGQQGKATLAKASLKKIGFRALEWQAIHAGSTKEAEEIVGSLQKIGCEVTTEQHGDHLDVKYRCVEWKSLELATDQLIAQWSTWFAAKGMETVVVNPPANTKKATVKFRMLTSKTVHLHDPAATQKIITTLKLVGCQVAVNDHDGHKDVTFGCPNWTTIELPSDENAHAWQKWLDDSGFETQHTH